MDACTGAWGGWLGSSQAGITGLLGLGADGTGGGCCMDRIFASSSLAGV